ncbi:MAG: CO dehydrogenase/acetyl-CoA synthase complex subunit alpha [Candidatus Bathyarchaeota archaeon]
MSKKALNLKVKELTTDFGVLKDLEISFGRIYEEKKWAEPLGSTPFPSSIQLRNWDHTLLARYKPFYMPFCDLCCLCTMGKCDLTAGKRGACGIDMAGQQSRTVLLTACIGASTHAAHARHLVEYLIEKYGRQKEIDVGGTDIDLEAPITRLVCGVKPRTLGDFEDVLDYIECQLVSLLAATHTGQEGSYLDFESKVFHAGMLDHLALEVADIVQVSSFDFPKADPEAPLAEVGFGVIDTTKPVILVIGHNVPPAVNIMDYLNDQKLFGKVEVGGICCTALDTTRYNRNAKIVGPISWQLRFIRSGVPDVVVVDEQCVRTDALNEAQEVHTPFIATSDKITLGLPDRTDDTADSIVADLVSGKTPGVLILNPELVGEVAVKTAMAVAPKRRKFSVLPSVEEITEMAKKCRQCDDCRRACPQDSKIVEAVLQARNGDMSKLAALYEACIGCAKCEGACPEGLPLHSFIVKAAEKKMKDEKFNLRVGRGAIQDTEIRSVGAPIVLGEIPGVIAFVGCANYPNGGGEVAEMAKEFAERRYIITASGCSAMSIGMYRNEEGKTLYEVYPGSFDAGGLLNVGSCVANSHIAGAAIKIASIFAKRNLRGNYEEIADYILNRVGAVGVAWGAYSQKAASIASGCWRLGIPVIVGPHGFKYRRMLLGRKDHDEDWYVNDARTGEKVYVGPVPEHLFYAAETKEECMVMIAKLCMRANDTAKGRAIKLVNYIDLHRRLLGIFPDDVYLFIRTRADVPITMKDEILKVLEANNWTEKIIPDPTLLLRMVRARNG